MDNKTMIKKLIFLIQGGSSTVIEGGEVQWRMTHDRGLPPNTQTLELVED